MPSVKNLLTGIDTVQFRFKLNLSVTNDELFRGVSIDDIHIIYRTYREILSSEEGD